MFDTGVFMYMKDPTWMQILLRCIDALFSSPVILTQGLN
jgi:hypothetical protein